MCHYHDLRQGLITRILFAVWLICFVDESMETNAFALSSSENLSSLCHDMVRHLA